MQTLNELNENFAIPGVLSFEEGEGGFLRAAVTAASCSGAMYLYGAHVTEWQPAELESVIFLSKHSKYEAGKAIRGGVPLIFPWFGARDNAPVHGFARTSVWEVVFAAAVGDAVHLTMALAPSDLSRELGYDHFRLAYEVIFGKDLTLRLSVVNDGEKPMEFEEGLHTYLQIGDIEKIGILGLKNVEYLDKVDGFKRKTQHEEVLRFSGIVDRPYLNTEATVTVDDASMQRKIVMPKQGSKTTVVWNPWEELSSTLGDMAMGEWRRMVCVEAVNAGENKVALAPKQAHTMEAKFSVVTA